MIYNDLPPPGTKKGDFSDCKEKNLFSYLDVAVTFVSSDTLAEQANRNEG